MFRRFRILAAISVLAVLWLAGPAPARPADDILQAVVGLRATVPENARTADLLGTERVGSGVVIDDQGLVLTIGYLVLEATDATLTTKDGREVPARIVAYDHESGLGLARATKPLGVAPMRLGKSAGLATGNTVLVASHGGPNPVIAARVVSRREFIGYWEYMLDHAIFTAPPHLSHSGAALVGADGRLVGIGSLFVSDAAGGPQQIPGNMFVPIDLLKPILADLLEHGRRAGKVRPWLGVITDELYSHVIVSQVSPDAPAARAGLKRGDIILGVAGEPVTGQADFYRKLWSSGEAGTTVPLAVLPAGTGTLSASTVKVKSIDRNDWLRTDKGL